MCLGTYSVTLSCLTPGRLSHKKGGKARRTLGVKKPDFGTSTAGAFGLKARCQVITSCFEIGTLGTKTIQVTPTQRDFGTS